MATLTKIHEDGRREIKMESNLVHAIKWNEDGTYNNTVDSKPVIGCSLMVGGGAYWLTTLVTEILSEDEEKIIFLTENSKYELTKNILDNIQVKHYEMKNDAVDKG